MAKWGKCEFAQLKKLQQQLDQLSAVDFDAFCRDMAGEIAGRLLAKAVKRTPVGQAPPYATEEAKSAYWSGYQGGTLRRAWTILPIEKQGGSYTVTVVNPTEYASYAEYGHRQTPGRYVPALGKRLKASWVPGKFMLTISTQEVESQAPKLLEKRLYAFLKGCLDGK